MRIEYAPPPPVPDAHVGVPTRLAFGEGTVGSLGAEMRAAGISGRAFVIADESVASRHGQAVLDSLAAVGLRPALATFPPGEGSKSLEAAARLYGWLASNRAERRDAVVAVGGGVAGDLGGFVAATWLRGVPLVQVPTTLLAMVDSSVGGKAAVNLTAGKNLVGSFHPPVLTHVDVRMLDGLPAREVRAGWAEVIKTAAIFDPEFASRVEGCDPSALAPSEMSAAIETAVRWKERTVHVDPRERGIRVVLNFGHTVAHAIEATAGYGTWLHGEAVAVGMVAAARLSVHHAGLEPAIAGRLEASIARSGLPVRLGPGSPTVDAILDRTFLDKKVEGNRVRWVLLAALGRCVVTDEVDPESVRAVLHGLAT